MQPIPFQPLRSWQDELREAITDPHALLTQLDLPMSLLPGAQAGDALFKLRVPYPYLSRIEKGNPNDPLLRQILPLQQETLAPPGYSQDPLK